MKKIIVIGGGAAGMTAAVFAAGPDVQVDLYDKNEKLGKKIYITGKGRCNFTNDCETEDWASHVCTNSKFMYSSFHSFNNKDVLEFFSSHGMPVKIERGQRAFPVSDHASDVTNVLAQEMKRRKVHIHLNRGVKNVLSEETESPPEEVFCDGGKKQSGRAVHRRITGVELADGTKVPADAVIVCTGGLSYPSTGSTGDGYCFAQENGHSVTECSPSLVPVNAAEEDIKTMQGLSLKNVRVWIRDGKKTLYDDFGEMMFTHFGVTGPLILTASTKIQKELKKKNLTLHVDLKPAITQKQLDDRFLREFAGAKNKQLKNVLGTLYPSTMVPVIIQRSGIPDGTEINAVTKEQRRRLCSLTKDFTVRLTSLRGYSEAVITRGGVSVRQIDPASMESRLVSGLYFAGEVLDVDAVTGGFNLQIAWSTGAAAGRSAGSTGGYIQTRRRNHEF